ncbi:mechanosensitive ion channel [Maribacter sp. PR1]|uniref:Mechanosensitive ion channel domain-containing protein n=1 Tax=Maribacter cobaltidurans TaxID=1178778 RepID=A0ABU7IX42_9FLAO|nr:MULTISPECIES: mechanosensitive ion channel domain-containing protein [Maribacter]MDC6390172.1 mechanosensitive ion channel [Maribacter sp. PR1]MEE1977562.1 mechanosensitive ion channel domain-containing protein [Maribacter cobaltidurans]
METISEFKDTLIASFEVLLRSVVEMIPRIFIGLIGLLVAWLIIKLILFVLKRVLKAAKIDVLSQRVADAKLLGDKQIEIDLLKVMLTTVKVLLVLMFTMVLAQTMGLHALSDGIYSILGYLPTLFSSLLILVGGLYLATIIKKAVLNLFEAMGIGGSKMVSNALFFLITFFVSITALNQAGVNTEIITSNFTLILGAFLLAFALALGLGSREVVGDLLRTFYSRRIYEVGDRIKIKNLEGTIEAIDSISMVLKTNKGKVVVPIKKVVENKVEVNRR